MKTAKKKPGPKPGAKRATKTKTISYSDAVKSDVIKRVLPNDTLAFVTTSGEVISMTGEYVMSLHDKNLGQWKNPHQDLIDPFILKPEVREAVKQSFAGEVKVPTKQEPSPGEIIDKFLEMVNDRTDILPGTIAVLNEQVIAMLSQEAERLSNESQIARKRFEDVMNTMNKFVSTGVVRDKF